jgi:hypothetical protein
VRAWVVAVLCLSCGARPSLPAPPHSDLTARIAPDLRVPSAIHKQEITIELRDLASGLGFSGRGVVVVQPRHALRMILLGPGGTTAMDVWIRDRKFRVAIPAISRITRGDESTPREMMRGMPVDLLWRLLVDPFGSMVFARSGHPDDAGNISGDGFTAWMRRGEVRTRFDQQTRAWFFDHGRLSGFVQANEIALGAAIVPSVVDYIGLDPAMRVRVTGHNPVVLNEVSPKVFADPDE